MGGEVEGGRRRGKKEEKEEGEGGEEKKKGKEEGEGGEEKKRKGREEKGGRRSEELILVNYGEGGMRTRSTELYFKHAITSSLYI